MTIAATDTGFTTLLPPHDADAERALIGSLLVDPSAVWHVMDITRPDDIYNRQLRSIANRIYQMARDGENIDLVSVCRSDATKTAICMELITTTPSSQHARQYARTVADHALRRRLINLAGSLASTAYDIEKPVEEVVNLGHSGLLEAAGRGPERSLHHVAPDLEAFTAEVLARRERPGGSGINTGYTDLDAICKGIGGQELVIIAGRTGMGKTAFALGLALWLARQSNVALFSLEMAREELISRTLARALQTSSQRIRNGDLSTDEWTMYAEATRRLGLMGLFIDDQPSLTPADILSRSVRIHMQRPLAAIVVDYLQLIKTTGRSRYEQVSEVARSLKNIAKEMQVPVFALAQLSRALENRGDKRPMLSDLRDSGEIEEAADKVLFLYRDDYYDRHASPIGELIMAKNRHGPTATVELKWEGQTASWRNVR